MIGLLHVNFIIIKVLKNTINASVAREIGLYIALAEKLKNAVTEESYNKEKSRLTALINSQNKSKKKSLQDTLNFWDGIKFRLATAFQNKIHGVSRPSIVQAFMKAKLAKYYLL